MTVPVSISIPVPELKGVLPWSHCPRIQCRGTILTPRVACIEFFCVSRRGRLLMRCADSYYASAGECIGEGCRFIHCKKFRSRLRVVVTFSLSLVYKFCVLRSHIGPTLALQRSRDKHYQLQHHTTLQFSQLHNKKGWNWIECNKSCFFSFFLTPFASLSIDFLSRLSIFCRLQKPVPTTELPCSASRHILCLSRPHIINGTCTAQFSLGHTRSKTHSSLLCVRSWAG